MASRFVRETSRRAIHSSSQTVASTCSSSSSSTATVSSAVSASHNTTITRIKRQEILRRETSRAEISRADVSRTQIPRVKTGETSNTMPKPAASDANSTPVFTTSNGQLTNSIRNTINGVHIPLSASATGSTATRIPSSKVIRPDLPTQSFSSRGAVGSSNNSASKETKACSSSDGHSSCTKRSSSWTSSSSSASARSSSTSVPKIRVPQHNIYGTGDWSKGSGGDSSSISRSAEEFLDEIFFLHDLSLRRPDLFKSDGQKKEVENVSKNLLYNSKRWEPVPLPILVSSTAEDVIQSETAKSVEVKSAESCSTTRRQNDSGVVEAGGVEAIESCDTAEAETDKSETETAYIDPAQRLRAQSVSMENRTRQRLYENALTQDMYIQDAKLLPPIKQYKRKKSWVLTMRSLIEHRCQGKLYCFGSCENGFWMKGSDVDACLVCEGRTKESWVSKLRVIRALLERAKAGKVLLIPHAKVPVAKVKDSSGVEIGDISVNNSVAIDNSFYVRTLALADPRVRHLGRVVKFWAMRRKINQRAEGTLSTYTIMLQVFYLLTTRGIIPSFGDLRKDLDDTEATVRPDGQKELLLRDGREINLDRMKETLSAQIVGTDDLSTRKESELSRAKSRNSVHHSIGSLFVDFFMIFGSAEFYGSDGIGKTIVDGIVTNNDAGALVMRCPITLADVNPMTSEVWRLIHGEFARTREMLLAQHTLEEILEEAVENPLKAVSREKKAQKAEQKAEKKAQKQAKEQAEKEARKTAVASHSDGAGSESTTLTSDASTTDGDSASAETSSDASSDAEREQTTEVSAKKVLAPESEKQGVTIGSSS